MFNNGGLSSPQTDVNSEEIQKTSDKLRMCMFMLFSLAIFRIFSLQFFGIMCDLITALIVYCTYTGKGKILAIFCLINAFLGIIYSIVMGSMDLSKLNNKNLSQPNNLYQNLDKNKVNNFNNISNPIPYKNAYGIDDNQNNKFNNQINYPQNNDDKINNNNFYNIQDLNSSNDYVNQNSTFNLKFIFLLALLIYSVVVYFVTCFYSYQGFKCFHNTMGESQEDEEQNNLYSGNNGGNNQNYGSVGRTSKVSNNNRNFVPFGGSGQKLEE